MKFMIICLGLLETAIIYDCERMKKNNANNKESKIKKSGAETLAIIALILCIVDIIIL